MLNELYALSGALSEMNISTEVWHHEYGQLPNATAKAPCYRIWVSETGCITGIDTLQPDIVQKLRRFGNNQSSFPALNIKPLYRIYDVHQKSVLKEMDKNISTLEYGVIRDWLTNDNWQKNLKKIDQSLQRKGNQLLKIIEQYGSSNILVMTKLIQAVSNLNGGFRTALKSFILSEFEHGEKSQILLSLLIHSGDESKSATDDRGRNISVILDLSEWEKYGYPIASEHTTLLINDVLNRADESKKSESFSNVSDAFGSPYSSSWTERMPQVKLPKFNVILRAMFDAYQCQQRYKEFNDSSYPIAKENRIATKRALEWLAKPDNEEITWKLVDNNEILFAYPSKLTPTPVRFTSLFGVPSGKENEKAKARFGKIAEDYIKSLKGIPPNGQPDYIRVFLIRKMDKARSKVILTRNCSPTWLADAAVHWQQGCSNVPYINYIEALPPFPLDVASVVNTVWKRNGKQITTGKSIVKRMQSYQGVELLLDLPGVGISDNENIVCPDKSDQLRDSASENQTQYILHILLINTEGLISYFGNSTHSGTYITPYYAMHIANITAVIGLLLYKKGYMKEDYMQNTAFLLGQMLKASDELHTFYCKAERNGDVPPQLVGNSMFAFAAETPYRALAQIGLRMQPYISWAKRYRTLSVPKNEVPNRLVGWNLGLLEDISNKLSHALAEPTRFNEYDKAQLFLGYLASCSKRDEADTAQSTEKQQNIGGLS